MINKSQHKLGLTNTNKAPLTDVLGRHFDDGRLDEVLGEDKRPLLQRVQQHCGGVTLFRGIHVFPGLQSFWPQEVVDGVHDRLYPWRQVKCQRAVSSRHNWGLITMSEDWAANDKKGHAWPRVTAATLTQVSRSRPEDEQQLTDAS